MTAREIRRLCMLTLAFIRQASACRLLLVDIGLRRDRKKGVTVVVVVAED